MPDQELLREAGKGTQRRPDVLEAQVRRMLADSKIQALVENFAGQWLETRRLESVQPDRERYPDFDDHLRESISKETELFFQYVMLKDQSVLDFIDGQYTFLNERLARHYGIRGVTGTEFRKVDLTGTGRGGILTQAGVLTVSSYGNRTSPVLRGKWVLENILNAPPPPPPANVPSLNEDSVGATASLRQQMEEHRKNAVCASCHARMDPLGFGLENYDAVGAWRTMDGKFPIDSSGVLPNGRTFEGAADTKPPVRLVFAYVPNGMMMDEWKPSIAGKNFEFRRILKPLEPFREDTLVLTGLAHRNGEIAPGDHAAASATYLTGVAP